MRHGGVREAVQKELARMTFMPTFLDCPPWEPPPVRRSRSKKAKPPVAFSWPGGSLRFQASDGIIAHVCDRVAISTVPDGLKCRRMVEILPGPWPDEWTGLRGIVVDIRPDGDCELETLNGGVFVSWRRLKTLGAYGMKLEREGLV